MTAQSGTDLTIRERDVIELVAGGLSNKEIGQRLGISNETVKTHGTAILRKLDVPNRAAAVSRWVQPPRQ